MFSITSLLGRKMAELTGKSEAPCIGIIKYTLKDEQLKEKELSLVEWLNLLDSALSARLEKMRLQNSDYIIDYLKGFLIENQSLFTIPI